MKQMIRFLFLCMSVCLFLVGCQDEPTIGNQTEENLELRIGVDKISTRTLDDAFETYDSIGVFAVKWWDEYSPGSLESENNYSDNVRFVSWDGNEDWFTFTPIYFPADGSKLDLYAYYPYKEDLFEASSTTIYFKVNPDQSNYEDYTASDLVIAYKEGVARTSQKVNLTFDHKLSQLVFGLKAGEGFTTEDLVNARITIKNAIIDAEFDLREGKEGIPQAGEEKADVIPTGSWQISENELNSIYGYKAIIIPQELNLSTYLEIKIGERVFTQRFSSPIEMESGESRSFIITLNNSELEITTTLNPWNHSDPFEGEATEEDEDDESTAFITKWQIEAGGRAAFYIEKFDYNYDFTVDWGDGSEIERYNNINNYIDIAHIYPESGVYEVKIKGICEHFRVMDGEEFKEVLNWGDLKTKAWDLTFYGCRGLKTIPSGMPDAESFNRVFHDSGLTNIPEGLFDKCVSAKTFEYAFHYCMQLESLPDGLFANCPHVESFDHTFIGCYNIESIGNRLFENCGKANNFKYTFASNHKLTEIPGDLFIDCINAISFEGTFSGWEELINIPSNLFANCTKVENFQSTFSACHNLNTIPLQLFDNNLQVINFYGTFSDCENLKGITPKTNNIEIWERYEYPQYPDNIDISRCFRGCTDLDNFGEIPDEAK